MDVVGEDVLCPAEDDGSEGEQKAKRQRGEEDGARITIGSSDFEEEARTVKAPPIPDTPSLEEVRQHRLTHNPYRSWCPHCVRGKGRNDRHMRSSQGGRWDGIPKVVSDYFFIGRRRPKGRLERAQ